MKITGLKIFITLGILFGCMNPTYALSISQFDPSSCDENFYGVLRHNDSYVFSDTIDTRGNQYTKGVDGILGTPYLDYNYNAQGTFPKFSPTSWLLNEKNLEIEVGQVGTILKANSGYKIVNVPPVRSKNNLILAYDLTYYNRVNNKWQGPYTHRECKFYEISWCGDGVLESKYGEQCDPKDPSKKNWGTDGCSVTCKPKNKPHTTCDQYFYDKLRYGSSYNITDDFKNTGTTDLEMRQFQIFPYFEIKLDKDGFPGFTWTQEANNVNKRVAPGQNIPAIKSSRTFKINYYPPQRKRDNGFIRYQTKYFAKDNGIFDSSTPYYHNECQYYEITRCGDGIVDNYTEKDGTVVKETCDPADPNKTNWGDGGCDPTTCEPVNKPAECTKLEVSKADAFTTDNINFSCSGIKANSYKVLLRNKAGAVVRNFVSNSGQFRITTPGEYTATCYVNDTLTAPACSKPLNIKAPKVPTCLGIKVTPTSGVAPFNSSITCEGKDTNDYKIEVKYGTESTPRYVIGQKTGSFRFTQEGTYTARCYAATNTNDACVQTISVDSPIQPSIEVDKREGSKTTDLRPNYSTVNFANYDIQTVENAATAHFTIRVRNNGNEALRNIVLTDKVNGTTIDYCGGNVDLVAKTVTGVNTYNLSYVGTTGTHTNATLEPGEIFTYECEVPNTVTDYVNNIQVSGIGVESNKTTTDNDDSKVELKKAQIQVIKSDGNTNDIRPTYRGKTGNIAVDDVQTVLAAGSTVKSMDSTAVFTIRVKNTGTESLKDIILTDKVEGKTIDYCGGTVDLEGKTVTGVNTYNFSYVGTVGNNANDELEVGETFTYDCEVPNTTKDYTNTIFVQGTGVYSGEKPTSNDSSYVEVPNPKISVDKRDLISTYSSRYSSYTDRDANLGNDSQTIIKGQRAVFTITVTNTGTEDLKDVQLEDTIGGTTQNYCGGTVNLITKIVNGNTNYNFDYVGTTGNHTNAILEVGESFRYTCEIPNTQQNYVNTMKVVGTGIHSNITDDDTDPTTVNIIQDIPSINVDKVDKNTADRDNNIGNNTQTVTKGAKAVFKITVMNDGNTSLKDIVLTDTVGGTTIDYCGGTVDLEEKKVIGANTYHLSYVGTVGNHANDELEVGEIFTYDCEVPNTQADYTNTISVIATPVDGSDPVGDDDDTEVKIPSGGGGGGGGSADQCESLTPKGSTTVNTSRHSQEYTCKGTDRNMKIDCGNGQVFTTSNAQRVNGKYTFTKTCNFVRGSSSKKFEPTCTVANTGLRCKSEITLGTSRGGGGGNGGSSGGGSGKTYCGDGEVHRPSRNNPNGTGTTLMNEECDFGSGTWPDWCEQSTCKIKTFTNPGENGVNIRTLPGNTDFIFDVPAPLIIGENTEIYKVYNNKTVILEVDFTNSNVNELYIGELCLVPKDDASHIKASQPVICKTINAGTNKAGVFSKSNNVLTFDIPNNFTTTTITGKQIDEYILATIRRTEDSTGRKVLYTASPLLTEPMQVRIAKPSVVTTGGGTSYVRDTRGISNTQSVTRGVVANNGQNQNAASVSVSQDLSGTTAQVTGNDNITAATSDGTDYNSTVTENTPSSTTSNSSSVTRLNLDNLDRIPSYKGIEGAYSLEGDYKIDTFDASKITKPTTFVVEGGNLEINDDIATNENIAFVVKGGNIIIDKDVGTITGTYIAIPANGTGGNITATEVSSKQLVINGSLYGNINGLTTKRTYLKQNGNQLDVGTIVSFGSSVFRKPAPLTSSFINEYTDATKVAR